MCRYAITYKPHFACFKCRKSFKRRLLKDISDDDKQKSVPAKCPECGELMADMGLDFKAPSKTNIKAWEHLTNLYSVGITFHSCGCSGPGYIPRDMESLILFLSETKKRYISNLSFWINYKEPITKKERDIQYQNNWKYICKVPDTLTNTPKTRDKEKAIEYWTSKIKQVEQNINELKIKQ